jgi:hypothetical protein
MTARTRQFAAALDAAVADLHQGHPYHILSISSGHTASACGPDRPAKSTGSAGSGNHPSQLDPAPPFAQLRLGPPIKAPADPLDYFTSGASHG